MFGLIYIDPLKIPITFSALEENSTVKIYVHTGNPVTNKLYYKKNTDYSWSKYNVDDIITLENVGDTVSFKNENNTFSSWQNFLSFDIIGKVEVFGNILSLTNYNENSAAKFTYAFNNCTGLANASNLLLPTLNVLYCDYYHMFDGCTNLINPPIILPRLNIRSKHI